MADSANVYVAAPRPGGVGVFSRAALGTTLPTDASTALETVAAGLYKDHGFLGEEGLVITETRDTTDHKAFGGDTVATTQDNYDWSVKVVLLEDGNLEVLKTTFGDDNVSNVGGVITVKHNKARLPRSVFVLDTIGDNGRLKRQVIPVGQVTTVGDITLVHTDLVKYELTVKAYPNGDGDNVLEYIEESGS
ncbi:phage tail tube protein [Nocardia sp. NPDC004260]